jgi:tripartite ATP-independent transporter DctM subunit
MDWGALAVIGAILLVLMGAGFHIAFALGLAAFISFLLFVPGPAVFTILGQIAWAATNNFVMSAIPLFILMSQLLVTSGLTEDLFSAASAWVGRVPGSLLLASNFACAAFATCSGSSTATVAAIGGPSASEMTKRGYDKKFSYGTLCTGGVLGILIPPSIPMIIYALFSGVSVGKLFMAGVVPGVILTFIFAIYIFLRSFFNPQLAPKSPSVSWKEKLSAAAKVLPIGLVVFAVLGTIYLGLATPTEAAALGGVASLILCLVRRRLTMKTLMLALQETAVSSAMLIALLACAFMFSFVVTKLRVANALVGIIVDANLGVWTVLIILYALYFLLGMFVDPVSMMILTLPTVLPTLKTMGVDPLWFGVIMVVMIETALLTPPVGANLFIMQGIAPDISMTDLIRGVLPYIILIFLLFLPLLNIFPQLALWLPRTMG